MTKQDAFNKTVGALRAQGLNSDEILELLCTMFGGEEKSLKENEHKPLSTKEREIKELLHKLCIPCNLKGYDYLVKAVMLYPEHKILCKDLYPAVAEEFKTTPPRVERAIRHAIETSWKRCPFKVLDEIFGNIPSPDKGKLTNGEFISGVVELIER